MLSNNQQLITNTDFMTAIQMKVDVAVWQDGGVIDSGGPISQFDDETVYIIDRYYLKEVCEFKVR